MKKVIFFFSVALFFGCQDGNEQKPPVEETTTAKMSMPDASLHDLFEEVNVVKMHLFGTTETDPKADNYPYVGKPIPANLHNLLDKKFGAEVGPVFACYRTENSGHYILRVPGKNVSGDLALAKWDDEMGKLVKLNLLAYRWCDEGVCNQQDSWLTDIDDDRDLELITRQHHIDEQGNISDEKFEVATDDGTGHFKQASADLAALAVKDRYVMQ